MGLILAILRDGGGSHFQDFLGGSAGESRAPARQEFAEMATFSIVPGPLFSHVW